MASNVVIGQRQVQGNEQHVQDKRFISTKFPEVINMTESDLETRVVNALQESLVKYQFLDQLTQTMLHKQQQGQSIVAEVDLMNKERELLMKMESEAEPMNEAYRASRQHSSDDVNQLIEESKFVMQTVIDRIAILESAARESFRRLTPEINQNVKGHQMKRAYGNLS